MLFRSEFFEPIVKGKSQVIKNSSKNVVFGVGRMVKVMYEISEKLALSGLDLGVVNVRFISPMDTGCIDSYISTAANIFSCEENVCRGGFGETLGSYLMEHGYKGNFFNLALPDDYMVQGSPNDVRDSVGFDPDSLFENIRSCLQ